MGVLQGGTIAVVDGEPIYLGSSRDASLTYNGTNLVINPQLVGTGVVSIAAGGLLLNNLDITNVNAISFNDPSAETQIVEGVLFSTATLGNVNMASVDALDYIKIAGSSASDHELRLINHGAGLFNLNVLGDVAGTTIGGITQSDLLDKSAIETVSGLYTFSDLTSSFGGVTGSNLLDKSAVETVSGAYTFSDLTSLFGGVAGSNLLDKSAIETVSGAWTFSDLTSSFGGVAGSDLLDKSAAETITGAWIIDNATGLTIANQGVGADPILSSNDSAQGLDLAGNFTMDGSVFIVNNPNTGSGILQADLRFKSNRNSVVHNWNIRKSVGPTAADDYLWFLGDGLAQASLAMYNAGEVSIPLGLLGIGMVDPDLDVLGSGAILGLESTVNQSVINLSRKSDALVDNTAIGGISFWAGSATQNKVASVFSRVAGTTENSGSLHFSTMDAGSLTERMVIDELGQLSVIDTTIGSQSGAIIEGRQDGAFDALSLYARDGSAPTVALPAGEGPGIGFYGFDGSAFGKMAGIFARSQSLLSGTNHGGYLTFHTVDDTTLTLDERMRINHNGQVGIAGTPTAQLHQFGTTNDDAVTHRLENSSAGSSADVFNDYNLTSATAVRMITGVSRGQQTDGATDGGFISTLSDHALFFRTQSTTALILTTSQRAQFVDGTNTLPSIVGTAQTDTGIHFAGTDLISLVTNGAQRMIAGNSAITFIVPVTPLTANTQSLGTSSLEWGDLYVDLPTGLTGNAVHVTSANQFWENTSTRRHKRHIVPINLDVMNILNIEPKEYTRIDPEIKEVGLVAEDIKKYFPKIINHDENGKVSGYRQDMLLTILLAAFQEYVKTTNKKINKLEQLIS